MVAEKVIKMGQIVTSSIRHRMGQNVSISQTVRQKELIKASLKGKLSDAKIAMDNGADPTLKDKVRFKNLKFGNSLSQSSSSVWLGTSTSRMHRRTFR